MGELTGLFSPTRVALIGATDREGSIGRALLTNLLADFEGEVVPVNPKYDTVMDVDCVPNISAAGAIDLAIVAVPLDIALKIVRDIGEAGVQNVVVITAGFSEAGSDGAARERELVDIATEYDLNLVGPNCLGVLSTRGGLNATFGPTNARLGSISLLSQSGAFVTAVLDWANDQGLGFRDVVSLGNKAVLDETDFIKEWGEDPGTDVVVGYLESIENGRAFIEHARTVTDSTPIVLVKAGRTEAGAQAASSHTGAIAGSDRAYEAGLAQAGVIRVDSIQALFDAARALAGQPIPEVNSVGIVTNAGGPGVLTTDAVGESKLSLSSFAPGTVDELTRALPDAASVHNPVDVIGDADLDRFRRTLDLVFSDENVGAVVVVSAPTAILDYSDLADVIIECRRKYRKPIVACLMGGTRTEKPAEILRDAGIPNYFDPARAVTSLDALARYGEIQAREYDEPVSFTVDRGPVQSILTEAAERNESRLSVEAMGMLDAYGIPTVPGEIVSTPEAATAAAREIGAPVVMKIVSPDILHKTDIGGVKIGVEIDEAAAAFDDLVSLARTYQPDAAILGVLVQAQVDMTEGIETIVGMTRDPQFGPVLLFGLGGIFVEVMNDVAVRVAPVSEREARQMTNEINSAPMLRGARGRDPVDVDGVVDTIGRLSQLVMDFPAILELDINPLLATPSGVTAIDIRLTIDQEQV